MNRLAPVTSSSTILVTVISPIRHFCIARPSPAWQSLAGPPQPTPELMLPKLRSSVVPAKAATHFSAVSGADRWIPAFAGTTVAGAAAQKNSTYVLTINESVDYDHRMVAVEAI